MIVVAAACLATLEAERLQPGDLRDGRTSGWWQEGMRMAHGRYPR